MDQQDRRKQLHEQLVALCEGAHIYFQPPSNVQMIYPAIRYRLLRIDKTFADNVTFMKDYVYELILIDRNPDSPYVDLIADLPKCIFNRFYIAENLNHWVFILY